MGKILVVVDMQNDFVTGALGSKEAQATVPNVVAKIKEFREYQDETDEACIVFTKDTHDSNTYSNSVEGQKLPVPHCIEYTAGHDIIPEIQELIELQDETFNKSTFGSLDLVNRLLRLSIFPINEIEVIGLCTDICVISNTLLLKAAFPNAKITVDASCCAGVTPQSHKNALEAMKMCHIDIINESPTAQTSEIQSFSSPSTTQHPNSTSTKPHTYGAGIINVHCKSSNQCSNKNTYACENCIHNLRLRVDNFEQDSHKIHLKFPK